MFFDLYFQLCLIVMLIITIIGHFAISLFIRTYPDLLDNGATIVKVIGSIFIKNKKLDKVISKYDSLNEKFELLLETLYWRSFYLAEIYLLLNILFGYFLFGLDIYLNLNFFREYNLITDFSLLIYCAFVTKYIKRIYIAKKFS